MVQAPEGVKFPNHRQASIIEEGTLLRGSESQEGFVFPAEEIAPSGKERKKSSGAGLVSVAQVPQTTNRLATAIASVAFLIESVCPSRLGPESRA